MKDIPILFTGEDVRAVLDDRKRVTRRVIKPQPELRPGTMKTPLRKTIETAYWHYKDEWWWQDPQQSMVDLCPYGKPGDRLWVRETWGGLFAAEDAPILQWRDTPKEQRTQENNRELFYRATDDDPDYTGCWIPSIHMPRWASRLTLEVAGVRVERVQRISREDCFSEGIGRWTEIVEESSFGAITPEDEFKYLWDSINKKRGYPWKLNPWVWVVEFKRVSR